MSPEDIKQFFEQNYKLEENLLSGAIHITDIPFSKRISRRSYYIHALRWARDGHHDTEYLDILKQLKRDICIIALLGGNIYRLEKLYNDYLRHFQKREEDST